MAMYVFVHDGNRGKKSFSKKKTQLGEREKKKRKEKSEKNLRTNATYYEQ
jgi:hypothetical protein